jgi:type IV pilus assembly protein PilA
MSDAWYYADASRQQKGPVTAQVIAYLHGRGEVNGDTLVWHAGLSGWEPLSRHAAALGIGAQAAGAPPRAPAAASGPRPALKPSGGSTGWVIAIVVLFVGIALLGIIAAIAIPAYSDYTVRAQVAQARATATSLKWAVDAFHGENARCPENGEGDIQAADYYSDSTIVSAINVGALEDGGDCAIQVLFHAVGGAEPGRELLLARSADGTWRESSNLPNRVLPASLRQ